MSSLLSDWCDFCEGRASFDKSHFLGLLKSHSSDYELRKIFSYFPRKEELINRARLVIGSGSLEETIYLVPSKISSDSELIELGRHWLAQQGRMCALLKDTELQCICQEAEVLLVEVEVIDEALKNDIPHFWIFELFGDVIRERRVIDTEEAYALFEALYGLAADYYLAWYIGGPLVDVELDFTAYLELWSAGGRCALTGEALLVSRR
ncbi:hypothetical protein AAFN46_19840 [Pseudomonas sp. CAU 1711]|uniref:hypothetical protein n=1 Tax=Pseudomonas sp. CAU 1711 TaxID=3140356 RepID=UPI00326133F4